MGLGGRGAGEIELLGEKAKKILCQKGHCPAAEMAAWPCIFDCLGGTQLCFFLFELIQ